MRSLLLTPCLDDSLRAALSAPADAIVLDLSDAVERARARDRAAEFSRFLRSSAPRPRLFAKVAALDDAETLADLDAALAAEVDAILIAGCRGGADLQRLAIRLAVREARRGLADGSVGVIAGVGGTAASLFALGGCVGASARLSALTFEADALSSDLGSPDPAGPIRLARDLTLIAARAAGVAAIDAATAVGADLAIVRADAERARDAGFSGKMALEPDQVIVINAVFDARREMSRG